MSVAVSVVPHRPFKRIFAFLLVLFSIMSLFTVMEYFLAERAYADDSVPNNNAINGRSEIVAPIDSFSAKDQTIHVFGYKIVVTEKTKFEDFNKLKIPPFTLESGQWLKIKAHKRADGVFVANKIRKVKRRPLYISITEDNLDTNIITDETSKRPYRRPLEVFLENESTGVGFNFQPTENLLFGGKLELDSKLEYERDLDKKKKKNQKYYASILRLDALWRFGANSFLLLEPSIKYSNIINQSSESKEDSENKLSRGFAYITLADFLALNLGRQDFTDERQWLYDEILDAARLYLFAGPVQIELSASKGRKAWDHENKTRDIENTIGDARVFLNRKQFISLWYVSRKDQTSRNFSPTLYGFRSIAKPKKGMQHWFEIARATGQIGTEDIDGFGVDLGLAYIFKAKQRPYAVFGIAYGSGQKDKTSQAGAFRQTGLQDNADKFGGLTSFHYYGEVVDPELSNKIISTMGMGARLTRRFSVDMIHHVFRQTVTSKDLGETRIKASPLGESPDLGSEFDIVFGYRYRDVRSELILGRFEPGFAFKKQNASHLVAFQFEYKF